MKRTAEGDDPLPQSIVDALTAAEEPGEDPHEEPLLPEVQEGEVESKEGDPKKLEEWERLEVEAEDVIIRNYTLVETLTSRHGADLKSRTCPRDCSLEVPRHGRSSGAQ